MLYICHNMQLDQLGAFEMVPKSPISLDEEEEFLKVLVFSHSLRPFLAL